MQGSPCGSGSEYTCKRRSAVRSATACLLSASSRVSTSPATWPRLVSLSLLTSPVTRRRSRPSSSVAVLARCRAAGGTYLPVAAEKDPPNETPRAPGILHRADAPADVPVPISRACSNVQLPGCGANRLEVLAVPASLLEADLSLGSSASSSLDEASSAGHGFFRALVPKLTPVPCHCLALKQNVLGKKNSSM